MKTNPAAQNQNTSALAVEIYLQQVQTRSQNTSQQKKILDSQNLEMKELRLQKITELLQEKSTTKTKTLLKRRARDIVFEKLFTILNKIKKNNLESLSFDQKTEMKERHFVSLILHHVEVAQKNVFKETAAPVTSENLGQENVVAIAKESVNTSFMNQSLQTLANSYAFQKQQTNLTEQKSVVEKQLSTLKKMGILGKVLPLLTSLTGTLLAPLTAGMSSLAIMVVQAGHQLATTGLGSFLTQSLQKKMQQFSQQFQTLQKSMAQNDEANITREKIYSTMNAQNQTTKQRVLSS